MSSPEPHRRRFRYAPTPSRRLHVGNGLAALIGWAAARAARASFILRIEDIDRTRCRPEFEAQALADLRWLGLDWDEGPDVGGPCGPYRQSERLDRYDEAREGLASSGDAYACVCSRADVRAAQRAPHLQRQASSQGGGEAPYPGTCRPAHDTTPPRQALSDRGGHRLRVGDSAAGTVSWDDGWCGPQREDVSQTCGDFLLGRPGQPTYQLAVVVDDIEMGVTDVVRGNDLLDSTARQILLYRRLGAAAPRFWHHPLIVDDQGRKLSKRDDDLTLAALRDGGADPSRLRARLCASVGLGGGRDRLEPSATIDLLAAPASWCDGRLDPP